MENCTQILGECDLVQDLDYEVGNGRIKMGTLNVDGFNYNMYRGQNSIGRDELSDVILKNNAISNKHAVIEVEDWDTHLLYDAGSTNKTRLGKIVLKPNVRYNLQGNDSIMFANLKAKYYKVDKSNTLHDKDDVSDTESESMLNCGSIDPISNVDTGSQEVQKFLLHHENQKSDEDHNKSSDISEIAMNNSVVEERKLLNESAHIVEASIDESTADEELFILPSQSVKEIDSNEIDSKINRGNKINFTEDIFNPSGLCGSSKVPPSSSSINNIEDSKDLFDMETQEPYISFQVEKNSVNGENKACDINTQELFNTDLKVLPTSSRNQNVGSEVETQDFEYDEKKCSALLFNMGEVNKNVAAEDMKNKDFKHLKNNVNESKESNALEPKSHLRKKYNIDLKQNETISTYRLSQEDEFKPLNKKEPVLTSKNEIDDDTDDELNEVNPASNNMKNLSESFFSELTQVNPVFIKKKNQSLETTQEPCISFQVEKNNVNGENEVSDINTQDLFNTDLKVLPTLSINQTVGSEMETQDLEYNGKKCSNLLNSGEVNINVAFKGMGTKDSKNNLKESMGSTAEHLEFQLIKEDNIDLKQNDTISTYRLSQKDEFKSLNKKEPVLTSKNEIDDDTEDELNVVSPASNNNMKNLSESFFSELTQVNPVFIKKKNQSLETILSNRVEEVNIDVDHENNKAIKFKVEEIDEFDDSLTQINPALSKKELTNSPRMENAEKIKRNSKTLYLKEKNQKKKCFDHILNNDSKLEIISSTKINEDVEQFANKETQKNIVLYKLGASKENCSSISSKVLLLQKDDESDNRKGNSRTPQQEIGGGNNNSIANSLIAKVPSGSAETLILNENKKGITMILNENSESKSECIAGIFQDKTICKNNLIEADMEMCSTVASNVCISSLSIHGSIYQIKTGPKNTCANSLLKVKESPEDIICSDQNTFNDIESKIESTQSKFMKLNKKENKQTIINQSSFFENPCSSSTPFKDDNINSPLRERATVTLDSPILPSVKELLLVADKSPKCKQNYKSSSTKCNNSPLACKRSPRVKRSLRLISKSHKPTNEDGILASKISDISDETDSKIIKHNENNKKDYVEHIENEKASVLLKSESPSTNDSVKSNKPTVVKKTTRSNLNKKVKCTSRTRQKETSEEKSSDIATQLVSRNEVIEKSLSSENFNDVTINKSNGLNHPKELLLKPELTNNQSLKNTTKANNTKNSIKKSEISATYNSSHQSNKNRSSNDDVTCKRTLRSKKEKFHEPTKIEKPIKPILPVKRSKRKTELQIKDEVIDGNSSPKITKRAELINDNNLETSNKSLNTNSKAKRIRMKPDVFNYEVDSAMYNSSENKKKRKLDVKKSSREEIIKTPTIKDNAQINKIVSNLNIPTIHSIDVLIKENDTIKEADTGCTNNSSVIRTEKTKTKKSVLNDSGSESNSSLSSQRSRHSVIHSPRRLVKRREQVLFTGLSNPILESNIKKLGGEVVDCSEICSVLVTDKVRRTVKFLCVVGQGKPIVTPEWIIQSWHCSEFLNPMSYLLKDPESEQKYNFKLSETIHKSKHKPLLEGYNIYATAGVKPPPEEIKCIVESCGGLFLQNVPPRWPPQSIILSHVDDKTKWRKLKVKSLLPPIVAVEMLLLGVLQYEVDIESHRIK